MTLGHVTTFRVYSQASAPFFLHKPYYTHTAAFPCNNYIILINKALYLVFFKKKIYNYLDI
jgi:hypothetical protein